MRIDLSGQWELTLEADNSMQKGIITLPGILQSQEFGNLITKDTPWVSGLHDTFWYEQEEYKQEKDEEVMVPFLAQPPRHFLGQAFYEREINIEQESDEEWYLRIELTRWRSSVWIDDKYMGEDCSLCTAHEIPCGKLSKGRHVLKVCIDNSMQYPYRPDGHGVSDALGATWNGMVGDIVLETASEVRLRKEERLSYAKAHPRRVEVKDGKFLVDGKPEYFRGTHFGGDYPLTGHPATEKAWWLEKMQVIKEWGLNAIRCHSYCPPEVAFSAADEAGIYLLVECGMWNQFEEDIEMLSVLRSETRRILEQFGHHPSFAFFSPSNEPGGEWYQVLREWVQETREYDKELGYEGRRVYTAESGWFYDVEPAKIEGTDFIYFHRSAYGPYLGGTIRNSAGWRGGDYSPSLEGAKYPVICHELGQWCVYPDFNVIDKFTGYMRPSNFKVFKEQARKTGMLPYAEELAECSGRNQLRLYKEDLEANFRTPEISGFELLDLHDYLGQGTALIGLLDAFWERKGYATPEEFRAFCGETVLLIRCPSYVWQNSQKAQILVEICHFGKEPLQNKTINWSLKKYKQEDTENIQNKEVGSENVLLSGVFSSEWIPVGENTIIGTIELDFSCVAENSRLQLVLSMEEVENQWDFYVYTKKAKKVELEQTILEAEDREEMPESDAKKSVLCTKDWKKAHEALKEGKNVVYTPWMSDLDYECPALSMKNVYWNSQMGPTWSRSLGIVADVEHPIFRSFPTEKSGGWQWEDILENSRGFLIKGMNGLKPIVRAIDDWNRSLPLALAMEAKVEKGKLFIISANLEGSFEERPAAYSLKQAIMNYVNSKEFQPKLEIHTEQIERNLFPITRMQTLVSECSYDEDAQVTDEMALFQTNPNTSVRIEKEDFPVNITISLKKPVKMNGILYLPEQRDRAHEGFLKDYCMEYFDEDTCEWKEIISGTFKNTSLSQKVYFDKMIDTENIRMIVSSCYGCEDKEVWEQASDGWYKVWRPKTAVLQIAGLHILCDEPVESSDEIFWEKEQKSATKEIEN